ncbi:hypothetical protein FB639_000839, partial [Coemansia asiatica]
EFSLSRVLWATRASSSLSSEIRSPPRRCSTTTTTCSSSPATACGTCARIRRPSTLSAPKQTLPTQARRCWTTRSPTKAWTTSPPWSSACHSHSQSQSQSQSHCRHHHRHCHHHRRHQPPCH